jgi:hypothetical protein
LAACTPFEQDTQSWGLEYLVESGFCVEIVDTSALTGFVSGSDLAISGFPWKMLQPRNIRAFHEIVGERSQDSIFFDFLVGPSDIGLTMEPIYRCLARCHAPLCIVYGGAVPTPTVVLGRRRAWGLAICARALRDPHRVVNLFARTVISALRRRGIRYPLPIRLFSGQSDTIKRFLSKFPTIASRVIPIHSFDYDRFLRYTKEGGSIVKDGTCVFIDDGMLNHPDWAIHRTAMVNAKEYARDMRALFDLVESRTGLRVVIAGHPKSNCPDYVGIFGDREIIIGSTLPLVAHASAVIGHASTALNFAVILKKTIILAVTGSMIRTPHELSVEAMALALGLKPVYVKGGIVLLSEAIEKGLIESPPAGYEDYLYRYIKSRNIPELDTWEIVANELRRLGESAEDLDA